MAAAAASLPDQITAAEAEARTVALPEVVPEGVAVVGMGGSGIAGAILRAVVDPVMVVPVLTVKGYDLPACVGPGWLVLAVSYSGETEEVLAATQHALEAGIDVVAVTRGGTLEAVVAGAGGTVITAAADVAVPGAGVGALAVPGVVLVDRLGLVPEDAFDVAAASAQAARRRDACQVSVPEADNPAKQLARAMEGKVPLFYGGGLLGGVAAYRAKCDVNENAKTPAFSHVHPELDHNEICAWGPDIGDVVLVNLVTGLEHPQVARRAALVASMVAEAGVVVHDVRAEGDGALARL